MAFAIFNHSQIVISAVVNRETRLKIRYSHLFGDIANNHKDSDQFPQLQSSSVLNLVRNKPVLEFTSCPFFFVLLSFC